MGPFDGKKHEPAKARDPRPKGAQKGTRYRDTERGVWGPGGKARSPWLSGHDKRTDRNRGR
jgi:hypothetical protein